MRGPVRGRRELELDGPRALQQLQHGVRGGQPLRRHVHVQPDGQHRVQCVRGRQVCSPGRHGLPHMPDDARVQHEQHAHGPDELRLQRGLRLERHLANLRGAPGVRGRQHVVFLGLRPVLGLHDVHGGQLRVDRVLGDGQRRVRGVRGRRELVRRGRHLVQGLHCVPGRCKENDCVLCVGRRCLRELHCWAVLGHHQRGDLHDVPDDGGCLRLAGPHRPEHVRLQRDRGLFVEHELHVRSPALFGRRQLQRLGHSALHVLRGLRRGLVPVRGVLAELQYGVLAVRGELLLERRRRGLYGVRRPGRRRELRGRHARGPVELLVRLRLLLGRADALVPPGDGLRCGLDLEREWPVALQGVLHVRLGRLPVRCVHGH